MFIDKLYTRFGTALILTAFAGFIIFQMDIAASALIFIGGGFFILIGLGVRYKAPDSVGHKKTIRLKIENNSLSVTTGAVIFGSYDNRIAAHYGNSACIKITSLTPGITYDAILAKSEAKPFQVKKVRISNSLGEYGVMEISKKTTWKEEDKTIRGRYLYTELHRYCDFEIGGHDKWRTTLQPQQGIILEIEYK